MYILFCSFVYLSEIFGWNYSTKLSGACSQSTVQLLAFFLLSRKSPVEQITHYDHALGSQPTCLQR